MTQQNISRPCNGRYACNTWYWIHHDASSYRRRHNICSVSTSYRGIDISYSDKVLDHYENPRKVGKLDETDESVGTGMVGAPACGDVMRLQIRVSDDGIIEDAKFKTYGCGSAIASSSLLTEWVKGRSLDDAEAIKNTDLASELALPPVKIHCSVLAEDAIKAAVNDYRQKHEEV